MAAPLLEAPGMQDLESSVRWGGGPAFYQHFAAHPCGLHMWGEMAERLRILSEPQFATTKEWLTDRYDSFKAPPPFRHRDKGKNNDTPPIVFEQAPRINILATSANDWFFRNLGETDSAGGFLPRWMIARADGDRRDVPIPQAPDANIIPPLAQRLKHIGQLQGEPDLGDVLRFYRQWYIETKRRFEAQPNRALALAYFNRHRGHVLKLSVISEASQSATLKVSVPAWERAFKFAEEIERNIFALLPTGMSAAGYDLQKIEDRIKRAGATGMSQNELTRCFQSMNPKSRDQMLRTLIEAGRIHSGIEGSRGRPKTWYRHADFHQSAT